MRAVGGNPAEDWKRLAAALKEIDFDGMGVFEILPPTPTQTARRARAFIENLLAE